MAYSSRGQDAYQASSKSLVRDRDHGGWIDTAAPWNFWQTGANSEGGINEVVYSCVQAYARTIAQLPIYHVRTDADGYDERLLNSPYQAVLSKPNNYQTRSDFLLNLIYSLLYEGKSFVMGLRDPDFRINSMHLIYPHACTPTVYSGEVFYSVAPEDVANTPPMIIPARDIAHFRLFCPHHPLEGETPLYAAAVSVKINNNVTGHQSKFFENMSRPSGVIETEEKLAPDQINEFRRKWDEQSRGLNSGKVPLLAWGFKWKPLSINSVDAELIETHKMSIERIASVYQIPLPLIGVLDNATYDNVFNLLNFWKSSGLGFVVEHIEQTLTAFFGLPPNERIELDTNKLLRTDMVQRIDALTKGITGGLYAPNEGRKIEGLRPVEGGNQPRVQQQMVPLDYEPPQASPLPPGRDEIDEAIRNAYSRTA